MIDEMMKKYEAEIEKLNLLNNNLIKLNTGLIELFEKINLENQELRDLLNIK